MESVPRPQQSLPAQPGVVTQTQPEKHVLRSFSNSNPSQPFFEKPLVQFVGITVLVILAGIGTGWIIAKSGGSAPSDVAGEMTAGTTNETATDEAGIGDESMFEEETPEGVLIEGGLDGEGTHHLDRNAGPEKMVYLTSSVLNLDNFVGKKVRVWGNSIAPQNVPWLMDVGKIKVIE